MTTLAEATLETAKIITDVREGIATAGTNATLTDANRTESATDWFTGGTIWFLTGANAGLSRTITGWDAALKRFTFAALANAVVIGVSYAACRYEHPRGALVQAVNDAISGVGPLPTVDATINTVANQESYALPADVFNVRRVEISQRLITDALFATQPLYLESHYWYEGDGRLYFRRGHVPSRADYRIRLWYHVLHAAVAADTGAISDYIHIERLKWAAAVFALRRLLHTTKDDNAATLRLLNEAIVQAAQMRQRYWTPVIKPAHTFMGW
jgi:hypothetical protein